MFFRVALSVLFAHMMVSTIDLPLEVTEISFRSIRMGQMSVIGLAEVFLLLMIDGVMVHKALPSLRIDWRVICHQYRLTGLRMGSEFSTYGSAVNMIRRIENDSLGLAVRASRLVSIGSRRPFTAFNDCLYRDFVTAISLSVEFPFSSDVRLIRLDDS